MHFVTITGVARNLFSSVTNYYSKRDNSNKVNNKYGDTINIKVINYKANGNGKKKYIYL